MCSRIQVVRGFVYTCHYSNIDSLWSPHIHQSLENKVHFVNLKKLVNKSVSKIKQSLIDTISTFCVVNLKKLLMVTIELSMIVPPRTGVKTTSGVSIGHLSWKYKKRVVQNFSDLPVWQNWPLYPCSHEQVNMLIPSTHFPYCPQNPYAVSCPPSGRLEFRGSLTLQLSMSAR